MRLTRKRVNSEVDDFMKAFPLNDKFSYKIISTNGIIDQVRTKDKTIIAWVKKKGFTD